METCIINHMTYTHIGNLNIFIDDEDLVWLQKYKYYYHRSHRFYRVTNGRKYFFHRDIMSAKPGQIVKFVSPKDWMDLRKKNLRFTS